MIQNAPLNLFVSLNVVIVEIYLTERSKHIIWCFLVTFNPSSSIRIYWMCHFNAFCQHQVIKNVWHTIQRFMFCLTCERGNIKPMRWIIIVVTQLEFYKFFLLHLPFSLLRRVTFQQVDLLSHTNRSHVSN